ncbi:MAG: NADH-quinone oxidoreductase subunit J [bacterium]|nr:NADH-quinone oxidoreductase subunit J [bacterium]MCY4256691.1 NADH-quinone oxidoreductase subunit J [bacterium]
MRTSAGGIAAVIAEHVAFGIIAAVMVAAASRVVTTRDIMHAALYLVIVLAGVAALFLLVGAEFTGITQVLIYIGAVIVLFLFGIMLTRSDFGDNEDTDYKRKFPALLTAALLLAVMVVALVDRFGTEKLPDDLSPQTTAQVSDELFSQFIVPFEAVSVLLLAALIGAIVVARREEGG